MPSYGACSRRRSHSEAIHEVGKAESITGIAAETSILRIPTGTFWN